MAIVQTYLNLIAPEHRGQPDYTQTVTLAVQPFVDMQNQLATFSNLFDVDLAVGQQLDTVGQWIGSDRYVGGVYLDDDHYRILLKAKIAANHWDGTANGASVVWNTLLNPYGFGALVQDYDNMTMAFALIGSEPDPVILALFEAGELSLKAEGVKLYNVTPPEYPAGSVGGIVGTPYFGLNVQNDNIAGLNVGVWGVIVSTE